MPSPTAEFLAELVERTRRLGLAETGDARYLIERLHRDAALSLPDLTDLAPYAPEAFDEYGAVGSQA